MYDANDGDLVHSLKGHKDTVYCVAYSKQGEFTLETSGKDVKLHSKRVEKM